MNDQKVSLGCGTLILIALIVLLVGNHGREEMLKEVRALSVQCKALEQQNAKLQESLLGLELGLAELRVDVRRALEGR